ncbi:MAG: 2-hydroxychromene-2-carboxylate isomerase [Gammaproteobacteria bacterium]|nr:2-hydroxychromene-2-carboxylate isomerase [Gammaproteobacteria bacterium]MYD81492.1 2-hydroxychromene-2-carboxylate isomerase [Gammaproteobacteria bacterium]
MNALETNARLILYLDIKSPYAYLAKDPAKQLESEFGIEVEWRPLTLNIPSFLGSARVDEKKQVVEQNRTPQQWQSVHYAYYDVKRYARLRDILIYGPRKIWDTSLAHIGWLYAKARGREFMMRYLDHVYEQFWKREIDVENIEEIETALSLSGCKIGEFRDFADNEGKSQLGALQQDTSAAGIFGVPTFVIDKEIFFGREHLPMIRWILAGKEGTAPDISY